MKRYRVTLIDFDSRAHSLKTDINPEWELQVQESHRRDKTNVRQSIICEYGPISYEAKIENFRDAGIIPFSVVAFHNKFFKQIRDGFVIGGYYPALTAACALGERILNHLILGQRDSFRNTPEYKQIYRKKSFDDWNKAIDVLEAWNIWAAGVADNYRKLAETRNKAIHFNPETDENDRELALVAIAQLREIIETQFGAIGGQPWFIPFPGESYIKKSYESHPFIKLAYLQSCSLVGPNHRLQYNGRWFDVHDVAQYDDVEVSDEEWVKLRENAIRSINDMRPIAS